MMVFLSSFEMQKPSNYIFQEIFRWVSTLLCSRKISFFMCAARRNSMKQHALHLAHWAQYIVFWSRFCGTIVRLWNGIGIRTGSYINCTDSKIIKRYIRSAFPKWFGSLVAHPIRWIGNLVISNGANQFSSFQRIMSIRIQFPSIKWDAIIHTTCCKCFA